MHDDRLFNLLNEFFNIGTKSRKYGLTGIGAIPYMTNFNVTLKDGITIEIGRKVAKRLRHSNPDETGCLGVQSMAFVHQEKRVEIACNVDLIKYDPLNSRHVKVKFVNFNYYFATFLSKDMTL